MSSILINFAAGEVHEKHRELQIESAEKICSFDRIVQCGRDSLDDQFVDDNASLLEHEHGAGLWLWKPYVILNTLKECSDGDIVFYLDADWYFAKDPQPFIDRAEEIDILLFHEAGDPAKWWCSRNTFMEMDAYTAEYARTTMLLAGYSLWKCCKKSIDFLEKWLQLCCRREVILPIIYNEGHCYDQSILTILAKKEGIEAELSPKMNGTILENSLDKNKV